MAHCNPRHGQPPPEPVACLLSGLPAHTQVVSSCTLDSAFYYQSTIWNHASCTSCGYAYDDSPTRRVGGAAYGGCGTTCYTNRLYTGDNKSAAYRGEGIVANTFKKTF